MRGIKTRIAEQGIGKVDQPEKNLKFSEGKEKKKQLREKQATLITANGRRVQQEGKGKRD